MIKAVGLAWVNLCAAGLMACFLAGCDDSDSGGGGSPAGDLNATGFWEDPLNGQTAAGNLVQDHGNVTGNLLLPPNGSGQVTGKVNGYHMTFTMAWDSGMTESGSGDFVFADTGVDKLVFNGNLPSLGDFVISWRGPSFEEHTPAGETLEYTPLTPTW